MISLETIWFLEHLKKMANQSLTGIKPISEFNPEKNEFSDCIYFDDSEQGKDRVIYKILEPGKYMYLDRIDDGIYSANVVFPIDNKGIAHRAKAPAVIIQSPSGGLFIKIKNGKWYFVDTIFD